jgi:hypothetical protein
LAQHCIQCGETLGAQARFCGACGAPADNGANDMADGTAKHKSRPNMVLITGAVVIVALAILYYALFLHDDLARGSLEDRVSGWPPAVEQAAPHRFGHRRSPVAHAKFFVESLNMGLDR